MEALRNCQVGVWRTDPLAGHSIVVGRGPVFLLLSGSRSPVPGDQLFDAHAHRVHRLGQFFLRQWGWLDPVPRLGAPPPPMSLSPSAATISRLFPFPLYTPCHRYWGGSSGSG